MKINVLFLSLLIFSYSDIMAGGYFSKTGREQNALYYDVESIKNKIIEIEKYLDEQSDVLLADKKIVRKVINDWEKMNNHLYAKGYYSREDCDVLQSKYEEIDQLVQNQIREILEPNSEIYNPRTNRSTDIRDEAIQNKYFHTADSMRRLLEELEDKIRGISDEFVSNKTDIIEKIELWQEKNNKALKKEYYTFKDVYDLRDGFQRILKLYKGLTQKMENKSSEVKWHNFKEGVQVFAKGTEAFAKGVQPALEGVDKTIEVAIKIDDRCRARKEKIEAEVIKKENERKDREKKEKEEKEKELKDKKEQEEKK